MLTFDALNNLHLLISQMLEEPVVYKFVFECGLKNRQQMNKGEKTMGTFVNRCSLQV